MSGCQVLRARPGGNSRTADIIYRLCTLTHASLGGNPRIALNSLSFPLVTILRQGTDDNTQTMIDS